MVTTIFILTLFFIFSLIYFSLKRMKSLNRNSKVILLIIFIVVLILFFLQIFDTDSKNLGSGFVYNAEHKHILGKIDIPPTIISYNYDKHFIVVKQKPKEFDEAIYDKMEYVYPLGRDTVYYWLIIKREQKVFGALDYDSFQKIAKEYKVPDNLY